MELVNAFIYLERNVSLGVSHLYLLFTSVCNDCFTVFDLIRILFIDWLILLNRAWFSYKISSLSFQENIIRFAAIWLLMIRQFLENWKFSGHLPKPKKIQFPGDDFLAFPLILFIFPPYCLLFLNTCNLPFSTNNK